MFSGGLESTVSSILDSIPMLVVGTNIGVTLINVRTREIITALSFNHIFQQTRRVNKPSSYFSRSNNNRAFEDKNDGIFGSMISQLMFGCHEETIYEESTGVSKETIRNQKLVVMGQRTSDAQTFALTLTLQKNCKKQPGLHPPFNNNVDSTYRTPSAKSQTPFSVVAQAPAKRGSLFENMQRKHETMSFGNSNLNVNPTALIHGRIKSSSKLKPSTSVPNLDENKLIPTKQNTISEVPHRVENKSKQRTTVPEVNNNMSRKNKSSGYGKVYDRVKMFEPNVNPSGKKRSSSTSQTRKKNGPDNHYYNPYHNHVPGLHRQQPERDTSTYKGSESNDGMLFRDEIIFIYLRI